MKFGEDGAGDDVARGEFGIGVEGLHEALAGFVDHDRAFAAQGLGGERRGIAANGDGGGVKLDEFRIRNHGPRFRRHADADAAGLNRVGGDGVEMADAAGRQHDLVAGEQARFAGGPARNDARDAAGGEVQLLGGFGFMDGDGRGAADGGDERFHDRLAGHIAADADDAAFGMGGLAGLDELAFEVLVERDAVEEEIAHAVAGFAGHAERHFGIDETGAGGNRIGGVFFGRVTFGNRRGNAALRPGGGGACAKGGGGENCDRTRAEFEGAEQTCQPAADDQDGFCHDAVNAPTRSCARRRRGRGRQWRDRS